jgi:hypothetical protein
MERRIKQMKRRRIVSLAIVFVLTACHLPNQTDATPLPDLITATPLAASSTPTLIPIETLLARATPTFLPTAVSTPRQALASPLNGPVNCRYGPSTAYAVIGGLEVGDQAEVVGKNIDVTWWYAKNPSNPSTFCWLAADLVDVAGSTDALPVVPVPSAQVTTIDITVDPPSLNVSCQAIPQYVTINVILKVNGPTTVKFQWETSEGEIFPADPLLYLEASSNGSFLYYRVKSAKDYWFQVHILSPNDMSNRITFRTTCVP